MAANQDRDLGQMNNRVRLMSWAGGQWKEDMVASLKDHQQWWTEATGTPSDTALAGKQSGASAH